MSECAVYIYLLGNSFVEEMQSMIRCTRSVALTFLSSVKLYLSFKRQRTRILQAGTSYDRLKQFATTSSAVNVLC